jgi:hypothetical protein
VHLAGSNDRVRDTVRCQLHSAAGHASCEAVADHALNLIAEPPRKRLAVWVPPPPVRNRFVARRTNPERLSACCTPQPASGLSPPRVFGSGMAP